jgi:methionyl-tRNA formyltransferase
MGTPAFAVGIADALLASNHELVAVVTVADKPAGRGQLLQQSAMKQFAVQHEIPVLQPEKLRDPDFVGQLAAFEADLFVVVAFRMLPEVIWKMPRLGTINLHASLLPNYRGAAPINWALINGETESGVSTFFINEHIDAGALLLQKSCPIDATTNAGQLHDQLCTLGAELTVETCNQLAEGTIESRVQTASDTEVKMAPKLFKENTQIDWSNDAQQLHNLIRGLSPYPAAWCRLWSKSKQQWQQFKIFESQILEVECPRTAGPFQRKNELYFPCKNGAIQVLSLQPEGKKRMDARSFLAGNQPDDYFYTAQ